MQWPKRFNEFQYDKYKKKEIIAEFNRRYEALIRDLEAY
jgi:hypothetical protein